MRKVNTVIKAAVRISFILTACLLFQTCDSWMSDDDFFTNIEDEVKVADAAQVSVYLRYASTAMGTITPAMATTEKVDVPFTVTAITNDDYGFYRWAAFSTSDFSTGTQYASLVYDSDYETNYAGKELDDSVVKFDDRTSASTTVTILGERNDIWIMPVCANRPTVSLTLPASAATSVVRNQTIRIIFSKAMDSSYFFTTNSDGSTTLTDNIVIQEITGAATDNPTTTTISSKFTRASLSSTQKILILKLGSGQAMSANTSMKVSISKAVRDADGYTMASDYVLTFTTGTKSDTYAPVIKILTGGYTDCTSFSCNATADAESLAATTDLSSASFTSAMMLQRTTGKVNIYAYAVDISESDTTGNAGETDVTQLNMRVTRLFDLNGNAISSPSAVTISSMPYVQYSSGDNASDLTGDFSTITNQVNATDPTKTTKVGYLFTYDVSSIADGLLKIDVWATDSVGNTGTDMSAATYTQNGNGYKSIFVVKDTAAPDIASQIANIKNGSKLTWFNASTLKELELSGGSTIKDNACDKMQPAKLYWAFKAGTDTSWSISSTDSAWKLTSAGDYALSNATSSQDGSVNILAVLKDDLGNISPAASLSSIKYDNTAPATNPSVTSTQPSAGTNSWSTSENLPVTITCNDYGCTNAESTTAASGMKGFLINTSEYTSASLESKLLELQNASDLTSVTDFHTGAWSSTSNTYSLSTNLASTSGSTVTYFIYAVDNAYNVSSYTEVYVINDTVAPVLTSVSVPTAITSTSYAGEINGITTTSGDEKKWVKGSTVNTNALVTLSLTYTETGSGVYRIYVSGGASLTGASTVTDSSGAVIASSLGASDKYIQIASAETTGTDATLLVTNVTLTNYNTSSANTPNVYITDFATNASSTYSSYSVYADCKRPSVYTTARYSQTYSLASTNSYAEPGYTAVTLNTLTVPFVVDGYDSGVKTVQLTSRARFTNNSVVTLYHAASSSWGTGVTLAGTVSKTSYDGDTITFETPITSNTTTNPDFMITVTNVQLLASDNAAAVSTSESGISVGVKLTSAAGWTDGTSTTGASAASRAYSITYDRVAPQSSDSGLFATTYSSYTSGSASVNVYPHASGTSAYGVVLDSTSTNSDGTVIRYFYTSAVYSSAYGAVLGIPATDNIALRGCGSSGSESGFGAYTNYCYLEGTYTAAQILASSNRKNPANDINGNAQMLSYPTVWAGWQWFPCDSGTDTVYSVIVMDAAGNTTPAYTFHVIKDTTGPALTTSVSGTEKSLTNVMTKSDPYGTNTTAASSNSGNCSKGTYRVYTTSITKSITSTYSNSNNGCTSYSGDAYVNYISYHSVDEPSADYRPQVEIDLSGYTQKAISSTESGLAWYAVNASSTLAPTATATGTCDWHKWHDFSAATNNKIIVYPSESTDTGPLYLWLKDRCGNTNCIQIRSPAHESASGNEIWIRDGEAPATQAVTTFTGSTTTDSTTNLDGTLVTSNSVNYFNDKASLTITNIEDNCISPAAATSSDYAMRFMLVANKSTAAYTKAEADAITAAHADNTDTMTTGWYYGGAIANKTVITFSNIPYPKGANGSVIHWVFEDAVGNFKTDIFGTSTTSEKWTYDNTAPAVYLRGTTTTPASADITKLVPANVGFTTYTSGSTTYFSSLTNTSGTPNSISGAAKVDRSTSNYTSYFDISVTEANAVARYFYSFSNESPTLADSRWISSATVNENMPLSLWTNTTYASGYNNANAQYVFLYVRDIVGNVTKVLMGNTEWMPDSYWPNYDDATAQTGYTLADTAKTSIQSGAYCAKWTAAATVSLYMAGSSSAYTNGDAIKVYLPTAWYPDYAQYTSTAPTGSTIGSGIAGYSFTEHSISSISGSDANGPTGSAAPYILVPSSKYKGTSAFKVYAYDHVGNYFTVSVTPSVDSIAPTLAMTYSGTDTTTSGYYLVAGTNATTATNGSLTMDTSKTVTYYKNKWSTSPSIGYLSLSATGADETGGTGFAQAVYSGSYGNLAGVTTENSSQTVTTLSGTTVYLWDSGSKTAEAALAKPFQHTITLNDYAGNASTYTIKMITDTTGPDVALAAYTDDTSEKSGADYYFDSTTNKAYVSGSSKYFPLKVTITDKGDVGTENYVGVQLCQNAAKHYGIEITPTTSVTGMKGGSGTATSGGGGAQSVWYWYQVTAGNTPTITGYDILNNINTNQSKTLVVAADTTAPVIQITDASTTSTYSYIPGFFQYGSKLSSTTTKSFSADGAYTCYVDPSASVTFTLSASDDTGCGVNTFTCGGSTISGSSVTLTADSSDTTTTKIVATDHLGHSCTVTVNVVPVATTAVPTYGTTTSSNYSDETTHTGYTTHWYKSDNVVVTIPSVADTSNTKIGKGSLSINSGAASDQTVAAGDNTLTCLTIGLYALTIYDNMGHNSTVSFYVAQDTSGPTATLTANKNTYFGTTETTSGTELNGTSFTGYVPAASVAFTFGNITDATSYTSISTTSGTTITAAADTTSATSPVVTMSGISTTSDTATVTLTDKLGNTSVYTFTLTYDAGPVITGKIKLNAASYGSATTAADTAFDWSSGNTNAVYVESTSPTVTLTSVTSACGIKTAAVSDGTTSGTVSVTGGVGTVTVATLTENTSTTETVTLTDHLGTQATYTFILRADVTAPTMTASDVAYGTNATTSTASTSDDTYVGYDYRSYATNYYKSGMTLSMPVTEAGSGIVAYALGYDDTNSDSEASTVGTYTDMTRATGPTITVTLDDATLNTNWRHYWLYVKDAVGQIGKIRLGRPTASKENWWRVNTVPSTGDFYKVTVNTNPGVIIKTTSGYGIKTITLSGTVASYNVWGIYFGSTVTSTDSSNKTSATSSGTNGLDFSGKVSYYWTPDSSSTVNNTNYTITFTNCSIADAGYIELIGTGLDSVTSITISDGFTIPNTCTFSATDTLTTRFGRVIEGISTIASSAGETIASTAATAVDSVKRFFNIGTDVDSGTASSGARKAVAKKVAVKKAQAVGKRAVGKNGAAASYAEENASAVDGAALAKNNTRRDFAGESAGDGTELALAEQNGSGEQNRAAEGGALASTEADTAAAEEAQTVKARPATAILRLVLAVLALGVAGAIIMGKKRHEEK